MHADFNQNEMAVGFIQICLFSVYRGIFSRSYVYPNSISHGCLAFCVYTSIWINCDTLHRQSVWFVLVLCCAMHMWEMDWSEELMVIDSIVIDTCAHGRFCFHVEIIFFSFRLASSGWFRGFRSEFRVKDLYIDCVCFLITLNRWHNESAIPTFGHFVQIMHFYDQNAHSTHHHHHPQCSSSC